tara:strand:+ start:485 stop:670 length:186 start_codon:yes stop_codon:yes gene_type:complete
MKEDTEKAIMSIANFIGVECSEAEAKKVAEATNFSKMKKDPSLNYSWSERNKVHDRTQLGM